MSLDSILDLPFTFFFIMLLSIEQTQYLCDKMLEKMKNVLELVKISTTSED